MLFLAHETTITVGLILGSTMPYLRVYLTIIVTTLLIGMVFFLFYYSISLKKVDSANVLNVTRVLPVFESKLNCRNNPLQPFDEESFLTLTLWLSSEDSSQQALACKTLLSKASKSGAARKKVINILTQIFHSNIRPEREVLAPPSFRLLDNITSLFFHLQSVEAIDLMISCINCGDGRTGLTFIHFPVAMALINMGESAVPKLSEALLKNEDSRIRSQVAKCLGNIGGVKARKSLEKALTTEKDKGVLNSIRMFF